MRMTSRQTEKSQRACGLAVKHEYMIELVSVTLLLLSGRKELKKQRGANQLLGPRGSRWRVEMRREEKMKNHPTNSIL